MAITDEPGQAEVFRCRSSLLARRRSPGTRRRSPWPRRPAERRGPPTTPGRGLADGRHDARVVGAGVATRRRIGRCRSRRCRRRGSGRRGRWRTRSSAGTPSGWAGTCPRRHDVCRMVDVVDVFAGHGAVPLPAPAPAGASRSGRDLPVSTGPSWAATMPSSRRRGRSKRGAGALCNSKQSGCSFGGVRGDRIRPALLTSVTQCTPVARRQTARISRGNPQNAAFTGVTAWALTATCDLRNSSAPQPPVKERSCA